MITNEIDGLIVDLCRHVYESAIHHVDFRRLARIDGFRDVMILLLLELEEYNITSIETNKEVERYISLVTNLQKGIIKYE